MIIAVVLLGAACLVLLAQRYIRGRNLSLAARQLRERLESGSGARLPLAAPDRASEELIAAVDALLARRQAERAEETARAQAVRRQIANVSHDLRTPLTSILGYLQLLEDPSLPEEERRQYLEVVERRARALQELISGFYDLSRLEGGEMTLARERVSLGEALGEVLAAFYRDLTDAGFAVHVDLPEDLPAVEADPAAVRRVFANLVRNILDHGAGRVDVSLRAEGEGVVSVFTNDAPGMDPGDVEHVFDRFFTADKMRTGRNTGLGLAIVRALAGQMGCGVRAALEGGRFSVYIRWKC